MRLVITALILFLGAQEKLPSGLQVGQLENPGARNAAISVIAGQGSIFTNQQLPATQLEEQSQRPDGAPFDMEFVGADLRLVLTSLAQTHGLNLVMPPDITGTVSIDLKRVTLLQTLNAILPPRGLEYTIQDNLLRVSKVQMETRTFTFNYITTQRNLSRSVSASSSIEGVGLGTGVRTAAVPGSSSTLSSSETTNLMGELETALNTLKSPEGKVILQKMAGVVFVTDYPRYIDTIGLFLETVQSSVHRQVVIEVKVIEVSLNEDSRAGVNWTGLLGDNHSIQQTLSAGSGFQIGAAYGDFNAVLTALKNQGSVNVLSSPTIATLNNQPLIMRVGTQDIFFTTTTQVDPRSGSIVQTSITPSAINEGIVLDVTPQISDDGFITMNVHPTITERTGQAISPRGDSVPIIEVRETDTVVRVRQGQTVFIGGLISDRQVEQISKVPVLGAVPLVGGLFRRTTKENRKIDLGILLTPRLLDIQTAVDYTRQRVQAQEQLKTEQQP